MKAYPRDVEVRKMKSRHVGIENELYIKDSHAQQVDTGWGSSNRDFNDEVKRKLEESKILRDMTYDGGGRELRTVPIKLVAFYQKRGSLYIRNYYSTLKESTKTIRSGGTHVHMSILKGDHPNTEANVLAISTAFHEQMQKVCGRKSSWATKLQARNMEYIKRWLEVGYRGRGRTYVRGYLMITPTALQTMEMRGGKGSNDVDEVLAWVEMLKNIVEASNTDSVNGVVFEDLIKGEFISKYVNKLGGWRKIGKKDLKSKVDINNL